MKNKQDYTALVPSKPALVVPSVDIVNLLTSQQEAGKKPVKKLAKSADMVMIGFRVTPAEKKEISRLALTLDTSVRDLMMRALDSFKKEKGIR
jgi:hypothetical protein